MSQIRDAKGDDPYADSPEAGDESACDCNGAWHARKQHCVDWPCPGCTYLCPPEPGVPVDEDEPDIETWGKDAVTGQERDVEG